MKTKMSIKEARVLVESFKKNDPGYKKAVEMCVEDDAKTEVKPEPYGTTPNGSKFLH